MSSLSNINVRLTPELRHHLQQQIGENGLYENASEYIRDLVRKDLKDRREAWKWLRNELAPAMTADRSEFVSVNADQVIARNRRKPK